MQEIKIKIGEVEYTLNNNNDKYERAKREAGKNASPEVILAFYDKLGGYINVQGNKIENGSFWETYQRIKEEQPKYIEILEGHERDLEESEKRIMELVFININHKRAFLNAIMTISAAVIAGIFILLISNDIGACLSLLVLISGVSLMIFIITASIYLVHLLSSESKSLDKRLKFIQESKKDFINKVGIEIFDIASYENFREKQHKEEKGLIKEIKFSSESWFIFVSILFILSCILLLIMFLSVDNRFLCNIQL